MVRIPESTINLIRSKTNIVDVASQYLDLTKQGQNHMAHCPFHDDKTPSFSVNEDKQIFKCFSCGRGGNVFGLVQEMEEVSFPEAVLKVADMSQVDIDPSLKSALSQNQAQPESEAGRLIQIHEKTKDFYQHILLNAQVGEEAFDYLESRGINRDLMKEFELGYSPRQRDSVGLYLQTVDDLTVNDDLLKKTGIFSDRDDPDEPFKDRFFNRIIFPLRNHQGHTVGFSGRIFETNQSEDFQTAKYLNSPETRIFNKRRLLFNFDKAKKTIHQTKETILFEGYMDVLAAWQAGVRNSVASMGTSLTEDHIKVIEQASDTIVLAFDGDQAGIESTKKTAEYLAANSQLTVEIISFPKGQDPDDYLKSEGSQAFSNLINHGRISLFQFLKQYYKDQFNLNNEADRLKYIELMVQEIGRIHSAIERDVESTKLAEDFGISPDSIKSQVQTYATSNNQRKVNQLQSQRTYQPALESQPVKKKDKIQVSQEKLLNRLFYYPEMDTYLKSLYPDFEFQTSTYQYIYLLYQEYMSKYESIDGFLDYVQEEETKRIISDIMWFQVDVEPTEQEIKDFAHYIYESYPLERQLKELKEEQKQASQSGNTNREFELSIEIIKLNKQLKR